MWVRGLKQEVRHLNTKNRLVAPYVGAWIETSTTGKPLYDSLRRTLCGCVD